MNCQIAMAIKNAPKMMRTMFLGMRFVMLAPMTEKRTPGKMIHIMFFVCMKPFFE